MELDYNPRAKECIDKSKQICKELGGTSVNPMDVFLATLISRHEIIRGFISNCTSDPLGLVQGAAEYCQQMKRIPRKRISWKRESSRIIKQAQNEAQASNDPYVGEDHIFRSCLINSSQVAAFLDSLGVDTKAFYDAYVDFSKSFHEDNRASDLEANPSTTKTLQNWTHARDGTLEFMSQFCDHINERVVRNNFQFFGRMDEINSAMTALCRKQKSNVLFVGEAGVGKTALVEGLALAMENPPKDSPIAFPKMEIFELKLSDMLAGAMYRGEFEKRLNSTLLEIKTINPKAVLFIDEFHMLIGAGSQDGAADASNILKPALANGEISCIGATTYAEYKKYIEKDAALARRFEVIHVKEPSPSETIKILQNCKENYENFHSVSFEEGAIKAIVNAADSNLPYRRFPDKAFDLLDEAGTFLKLQRCKKPKNLIDLEHELKELPNIKHTLGKRDVKTYELKIKGYEEGMNEWIKGIESPIAVSEKDILLFIKEKFNLHNTQCDTLAEFLNKRVTGQASALNKFVRAEKASKFRKKKEGPELSMLLAGPSGVGKTWLATSYAEYFPASKAGLSVFDMSQYSDATSVNKLIGSSAGYVGYDQGGVLTEKLKNNPKLILLFENIERAHPTVIDLISSIINSGSLQDNIGQVIDCSRCKVFFTTHQAEARSAGFTESEGLIVLQKDKLPKDIVDGVDKIILLNPLDLESLKELISRRVKGCGLDVEISEDALEFVAKKANTSNARPALSLAEDLILTPIYEMLNKDNEKCIFSIKMLDNSINIDTIKGHE